MTDHSNTLFITGAGVSAESGIPTFRGSDGYWKVGSANYTPQEMATRKMYREKPKEFLNWYFQRFATYRHHGPNDVHHWLADKNLITQNIDGLDGKAGNQNYIAVHGRLDKMTLFHQQGQPVDILDAPWDTVDPENPTASLLELFRIRKTPELNQSFKPYVLLFDELYTELYRISEDPAECHNLRSKENETFERMSERMSARWEEIKKDCVDWDKYQGTAWTTHNGNQ